MGTTFSDENRSQEFGEIFFMSKSEEFYSKATQELPDTWQQVIENNGEYIIEENMNILYFLENKHQKSTQIIYEST